MTDSNFQIPIPPDILAEITGWHKVARLDDSKRGVIVPTEAAGEELFFQMLPWGFWRYRLMRGEQVVRGAYCSGPIVVYTEFEPFKYGNKAKHPATSNPPQDATPTRPSLSMDIENIAECVRIGVLSEEEALCLVELPEDLAQLQQQLDALKTSAPKGES